MNENICGCSSATNDEALLLHLTCSPRHCRCAGRARDVDNAAWADLVEEVEIEDTLLAWAGEDNRG